MKNKLKKVRAQRGVTLRQLARCSGLNLTLVWELECDLRDPTPKQREAICRTLHVNDRDVWTAPRAPRQGHSTAA